MVKSLIFCTLICVLCLNPVLAQESGPGKDDTLKNQVHSYFQHMSGSQASTSRVSGYAGLMTTGSMTAYYGGLQYAIKDNQSLRLEMSYGSPFNSFFQPAMNNGTRIFAPSLLYQYTLIGKQGDNFSLNNSGLSKGFSLYTFAGAGLQVFNQSSSLYPTEGLMKVNSRNSYNVVIPLGIGMHYKFDNDMTIGFEIRGNFHISNGGYPGNNIYGIDSYRNSFGQWGYPGVMFGQYRNGPGF